MTWCGLGTGRSTGFLVRGTRPDLTALRCRSPPTSIPSSCRRQYRIVRCLASRFVSLIDAQRPRVTSPPLLEPVRTVFRAVATSVVPECAQLRADEWAEFDGIIEDVLATRPEGLRKQLLLFIRALEALPVARYATRFSRLDGVRRQRVLTALQNSRISALRRGFWGLRTLIFMGYYARPAAATAIGYRASAAGWSARRKPNDPAPPAA